MFHVARQTRQNIFGASNSTEHARQEHHRKNAVKWNPTFYLWSITLSGIFLSVVVSPTVSTVRYCVHLLSNWWGSEPRLRRTEERSPNRIWECVSDSARRGTNPGCPHPSSSHIHYLHLLIRELLMSSLLRGQLSHSFKWRVRHTPCATRERGNANAQMDCRLLAPLLPVSGHVFSGTRP